MRTAAVALVNCDILLFLHSLQRVFISTAQAYAHWATALVSWRRGGCCRDLERRRRHVLLALGHICGSARARSTRIAAAAARHELQAVVESSAKRAQWSLLCAKARASAWLSSLLHATFGVPIDSRSCRALRAADVPALYSDGDVVAMPSRVLRQCPPRRVREAGARSPIHAAECGRSRAPGALGVIPDRCVAAWCFVTTDMFVRARQGSLA